MTTTRMILAGKFNKDDLGIQGSDGKVYQYSYTGDKKRYVVIRKAGSAGDSIPCTVDGTMKISSLSGSTGDSIHPTTAGVTGMAVNNELDGGIGYLVANGIMHKYDNFVLGGETSKTIYVIEAVTVGAVVYKLANGGTYANAPDEVWGLADNTVEAKVISDLMVVTKIATAQTTTSAVNIDTEVAFDLSAISSVGDPLYLSINGELTPTEPSTSGHFSRVIANANANTIQVNIDPSWGEIA